MTDAREKHRVNTFANAEKMGLEPIEIVYEDDRPVEIVVRNPKTENTFIRVLGGRHKEHPGTGPLGLGFPFLPSRCVMNKTVDPRLGHSNEEWGHFMQNTRRWPANNKEFLAMLKDVSVSSFTVVQEANIGGEYHRVLCPQAVGNDWCQHSISNWSECPLAVWSNTFLALVEDKEYVYEDVRFRAQRQSEYRVTFCRC